MTANDRQADVLNETFHLFGIERSRTQDRAAELATRALETRGHRFTLNGLRWGVLTVVCDPLEARLISYSHDQVISEIERELPGVVRKLKIVPRAAQHRTPAHHTNPADAKGDQPEAK
jgi:hypothetical protein